MDKDLFAEALAFSSAQQGFESALIEKDYFCNLVLAFLSVSSDTGLVFKGRHLPDKSAYRLLPLSEDAGTPFGAGCGADA